MHPSLSTALSSLDEYIAYLTGIRAQLAQGGTPQGFAQPAAPRSARKSGPKRQLTKRKVVEGSPRKDEVAAFIKTHGPSTRSDLLAGTKVPAGTLAYALNDKTRFKRLPDGRWDMAA